MTEKEEWKYEYCDEDERRKINEEVIKKFEEENSNEIIISKEEKKRSCLAMIIGIMLIPILIFAIDFMTSIINYICSLFY